MRVLIILLFTVMGYSQITIQNNGYVYADSTLVYSEDYVNIDGHLYLRNQAQLIQKNNTINGGLGQLSVYQWGTVNQYSYNYWCSPVGNPFIANLNIYDAVSLLNSNLATYYTTGYNSTTNPLVIADYWIWKYITGTQYSQWIHVRSTGNVDVGYGFTMKGTPSSNQLYDFRGIPNNGYITVSVLDNNLTLMGNPYPSALDAYEFIWNTNNQIAMTGVLYYWEQETTNSHILVDYIGGYATYTIDINEVESFVPAMYTTYNANGDPLGTNNGIGTKIAKRYIPIGQGFMIEGAGNSNFVEITNSMRKFIMESSGDSYFFRSSNTSIYNQVPNDYRRFRLNITLGNGYTRQLLMNFHNSATDGYDYGMEALYESALPIDAYWLPGKLINANKYSANREIPIYIKSNIGQTITFRLSDVQNFGGKPIYLYNSTTNDYFDLTSDNVSHFIIGDSDEFSIRFNKSNNPNQKSMSPKAIKSIDYYTIDGKIIGDIEAVSSGVYIEKIIFIDNSISTRKIIIH